MIKPRRKGSFNGLALCSGYDGIGLGLGLVVPGYRTVCHVEREAFAAANLAAKIEAGLLAPAPVWADLADFDGNPWRGVVDIVTAGIPCQPFSVAGKRKGIEDERWLWPDVWRIVREVRPRFLFLEEVHPGFVRHGLEALITDLAASGWAAEWDVFSARAVGAPHKRERLFILAEPNCAGWRQKHPANCEMADDLHSVQERQETTSRPGEYSAAMANTTQLTEREQDNASLSEPRQNAWKNPSGGSCGVANPQRRSVRLQSGRCRRESRPQETLPGVRLPQPFPPGPSDLDAWQEILNHDPSLAPATLTDLRRVAHGSAKVMDRLDRLRLCGNGVVPLVAAVAFSVLARRLGESP